MDADHFDALSRSLSTVGSRRRALGGVFLGALGLLGRPEAGDVIAHDLKATCKKKSGAARKKCLKKAKKHRAGHAATGGGGTSNVRCVGPILPPCPSGTTCGRSEICFEGECVEDPEYRSRPRCTSSADCEGVGCYNGWCRNPCGVISCPGGCVPSSDGVTEVCLECDSDTDCDDYAPHCANNDCGFCAIDAHCPPGEVCRGGHCFFGCGSDADCAAAPDQEPLYLSCFSGACTYNRHHVECHTLPGGSGGA